MAGWRARAPVYLPGGEASLAEMDDLTPGPPGGQRAEPRQVRSTPPVAQSELNSSSCVRSADTRVSC
ncbi:MAG TPA: hypothetical protein VFV80_11185, partial [Geminicoccaceae bacterium]|nr:hypothetical protein [Geminicoccaceae bacterium]